MAIFRSSASAFHPGTVRISVAPAIAFSPPGIVGDSGESVTSPTFAWQSFGSRR
jgi:hypothetical protein